MSSGFFWIIPYTSPGFLIIIATSLEIKKLHLPLFILWKDCNNLGNSTNLKWNVSVKEKEIHILKIFLYRIALISFHLIHYIQFLSHLNGFLVKFYKYSTSRDAFVKNSFFTTYLAKRKNDALKYILNLAAKNYLKIFYFASDADIWFLLSFNLFYQSNRDNIGYSLDFLYLHHHLSSKHIF